MMRRSMRLILGVGVMVVFDLTVLVVSLQIVFIISGPVVLFPQGLVLHLLGEGKGNLLYQMVLGEAQFVFLSF